MARGERLTKDIYEAVRAGRGWNKTLLAIVYDDAGGMYDHVVPPVGVPSDESPCNVGNIPPHQDSKWDDIRRPDTVIQRQAAGGGDGDEHRLSQTGGQA
eukprot:SAG31_NODE_6206_length_2122_cov_1.416708_2_plen_99_part_00